MSWPKHLKQARPELDIRARRQADATAEDLDWAEVFFGFRKPRVAGWGSIRWAHSIGAGVDGLLQSADLPDHILVTRSSEDFGPAIGEYCIARALAVTQKMRELESAQRRREWAGTTDPVRIAGTRAVIVGTGNGRTGDSAPFAAMGCVVDGLSRSGEAVEPFASVGTARGFRPHCKGRAVADPGASTYR